MQRMRNLCCCCWPMLHPHFEILPPDSLLMASKVAVMSCLCAGLCPGSVSASSLANCSHLRGVCMRHTHAHGISWCQQTACIPQSGPKVLPAPADQCVQPASAAMHVGRATFNSSVAAAHLSMRAELWSGPWPS